MEQQKICFTKLKKKKKTLEVYTAISFFQYQEIQ